MKQAGSGSTEVGPAESSGLNIVTAGHFVRIGAGVTLTADVPAVGRAPG